VAASLALAAASAWATPFATGADVSTAMTMTVDAPSVTASYAPDPNAPTQGQFWFKAWFNKGQTIRATLTAPTVDRPNLILWPAGHAAFFRGAPKFAPVQRVTFMASASGWFNLYLYGNSSPTTFTLDVHHIPAVAYRLSSVSAPVSIRRHRSFAVSSMLTPDYDSTVIPVKFLVERYYGRKWHTYLKPVAAYQSSDGVTSTRYSANLRLPKGRFRVRAKLADAAHSAVYSARKVLVVK
jgi:hypothetical protein